MKSAREPSLRAPYAPGQRAPSEARPSAAASERQDAESEVTAIADEFAAGTHDAQPPMDQEDPQRGETDGAHATAAGPRTRLTGAGVGTDADTDASVGLERATYRHNGHTQDAGRRASRSRDRDRERDREHDQSYTPAHLRAEMERDGLRDESESGPFTGAGREGAGVAPASDVRGAVGPLIDELKALFQHDRATASATGGTRCGICYLHYALDALEYREEEGYYVCAACARTLGAARVPMVRRQKRG